MANKSQENIRAAVRPMLLALGIATTTVDYVMPFVCGEKQLPIAETDIERETAIAIRDAKLTTLTAAAKILGMSRVSVWRLCKDGALAPVCVRGKNHLRLSDVLAFSKKGQAAREAVKQ